MMKFQVFLGVVFAILTLLAYGGEIEGESENSAVQIEGGNLPKVPPKANIDKTELRQIENLIDQLHRTKAILDYADHAKGLPDIDKKVAEYKMKLAKISNNPPIDPDEGLPDGLEKAKQAYNDDWNCVYSQLRSAVGGTILVELLDTEFEPFVRFMTMYVGSMTVIPTEYRDNFAESSGINPYIEPDLFWSGYKKYLRKMFSKSMGRLETLQEKFDIHDDVVEIIRDEMRKSWHMMGYQFFSVLHSDVKIQQSQKYLDVTKQKLRNYPSWQEIEKEMFQPNDAEDKQVIKIECVLLETFVGLQLDWETTLKVKNILNETTNESDISKYSAIELVKAALDKAEAGEIEGLIDVLVSRGYMKIIANPLVEVFDGYRAKLTIRSAPNGTDEASVQVSSMDIMPEILENGDIGVKVKVGLTSKKTPNNKNAKAIVSTRLVESTVHIRPGESQIIGETIKTEIEIHERNKSGNKRTKEVLIILTPTIVINELSTSKKTCVRVDGGEN